MHDLPQTTFIIFNWNDTKNYSRGPENRFFSRLTPLLIDFLPGNFREMFYRLWGIRPVLVGIQKTSCYRACSAGRQVATSACSLRGLPVWLWAFLGMSSFRELFIEKNTITLFYEFYFSPFRSSENGGLKNYLNEKRVLPLRDNISKAQPG
jgi:hypothetical protein